MKSRSTEAQTPEGTYQYALRLLAGRDYSAARMREKLVTRDVSEHAVEVTILRLQEEGWIDDRRFAERFAEMALSSGRFFGPRLRQEMHRRGVPVELADEIIKRVRDEYDEAEELRLTIDRRYPGFVYSAVSDREKRRVISWLLRRGFGIAAVMRALRESVQSISSSETGDGRL
ncbi:MAG: regulatory protein RecX [Desulfuromonadales bacterium]